MQSQLRRLLERTAPESTPAPRPERTQGHDTPARHPAPASGPPVAPTGNPAERRLKLVIETAPVSLIIIDPEGQVLAANRAAVALLGAAKLDEVLGKSFDGRLAAEDRERFATFLGQVCRGEPGSLEYDIALADGTRRTLETQAVPLRREGTAPVAFLGASWDAGTKAAVSAASVQDLQARYDLLEAEHTALTEALAEARAAFEDLARERQAERCGFEEALQDARHKLEVALTDASGRNEHLSSQWSAERDTLLARVREAEDRHAQLSAQLLIEQKARESAAELAERERQELLAARAEETQQLETALNEARASYEQMLAEAGARYSGMIEEWHAKYDHLGGTIRELERRAEEIADERRTERDELEKTIRAERARAARLLEEREQWQNQLAEALIPLRETNSRIEQLMDQCQKIRHLPQDAWQSSDDRHAEPADSAAGELDSSEEATWQF